MTDQHSLYDYDADAQPDAEKTITIAHVDEPHDVYGGRHSHGAHMGETLPPEKGWLGNPYRLSDFSREQAINRFEMAFHDELRKSSRFCNAVLSLTGKVVACHCRRSGDDEPACHLDVVRNYLLEGYVHWIAHHEHDIALTEAEHKQMADDPEGEI
jgi:hypothetical protein